MTNYTFAGKVTAASGSYVDIDYIESLVPELGAVPPSGNRHIYYQGASGLPWHSSIDNAPVMSASYTIDPYGKSATYSIQTQQRTSMETLPSGVLDYELSVQITPRFKKYAEVFIPGKGVVYDEVGFNPEQKTISGFFIGETLKDAENAAKLVIPDSGTPVVGSLWEEALGLGSPANQDYVPKSLSQTVDPRQNKVSFSYSVNVPNADEVSLSQTIP